MLCNSLGSCGLFAYNSEMEEVLLSYFMLGWRKRRSKSLFHRYSLFSSSVQFQSGFLFVTDGDRMHLIPSTIALILSLHLVRSPASSIFNPTSFALSSTCILHVSFDRPRFHFPFPSSSLLFLGAILHNAHTKLCKRQAK